MKTTYAYSALAAVLLFGGLVVVLTLIDPASEDDRSDADGVEIADGAAAPATGPSRGAADGTGPPSRSPRRDPVGVDPETGAATVSPPPAEIEPDPDRGPRPLPPGLASLAFRVLDGRDHPLAGVLATLRTGRSAGQVESDADGVVRFDALAAGVYSCLFDAEDRPVLGLAEPVELEEGEAYGPVDVHLGDWNLSIAGRVLDLDGKPVAGIEVTALPRVFGDEDAAPEVVPWGVEASAALSAEEGRFHIDELASGEYELRTTATERYPAVRGIAVRAGVDSVDIVLESTREIRVFGVVRLEDGTPVADVRVMPVGQGARSGLTDEAGVYDLVIEVSERRRDYTLRIVSPTHQERLETLEFGEFEGVDEVRRDVTLLPLKGLTVVTGQVLDEEERPLAGEIVHLQAPAVRAHQQATTDENGRFSVEGIQAQQTYRVSVRPRGPYRDYTEAAVLIPSEGLFLRIVLEPLEHGTLRGRFVDAAGSPVPRFSLWCRSSLAAGRSVQITSDDAGRFSADDIPEGKLMLETRSLPRIAVNGLTLDAETPEEVEIVIDWGDLELSGRVLDPRGDPIPGARVFLSWFDRRDGIRSTSSRQSFSDESGAFTFSQLGSGEHRVSVNAKGFRSGQTTVEIGRATMVEIRLEDLPGTAE